MRWIWLLILALAMFAGGFAQFGRAFWNALNSDSDNPADDLWPVFGGMALAFCGLTPLFYYIAATSHT